MNFFYYYYFEEDERQKTHSLNCLCLPLRYYPDKQLDPTDGPRGLKPDVYFFVTTMA